MKTIIINKTKVEWDIQTGTCTFNGIPAVSMWVNSTYHYIMNSIVEMVGEERFLFSQQKQGRDSVTDDWVIISQYSDFAEGIKEHSKLAAVGGWGVMKLIELDANRKQAIFQIHNGVEGLSQKAANVCWGSGIIAGKLAGFCERLFNCHCWPEQTKFIAKGDDYDEFRISESNKTLERELTRLIHADQATKTDMTAAFKLLETEIKFRLQAENEAQKLANYDVLTGLTNRRFFNKELSSYIDSSIENNQYGALLFMDLDNFKDINDSLGHDRGDLCLEVVSNRLLMFSNILPHITSVSRIGGDEFTLLISSLSKDMHQARIKVEAIAKQLIEAFNEPVKIGEQFFYQQMSIGIRLFPNHNNNADSMLKQADITLYKAKQEGKNQFYFFEHHLQLAADKRLYAINELQHSLINKRFLLYFQPIFNIDNDLVAYESLVRWKNNNDEIESAYQFIETIEKSSLMLDLGKFIFTEACKQLEKWQEKGLPTQFDHLSINISPIEFVHPDFVDFVEETINKFNINPSYITLEITENLMLRDFDFVKSRMKILKKMGFRFSLDDFGTGYSSLSYLHELPFSELKVVVEGIETSEQNELLKKMGCEFFQGFFLGKPNLAD